MNHADRQALLIKLGLNQSKIARELGVNPAAVSGVVTGRSRSRRIEDTIANLTKTPLSTLWPEWYGDETSNQVRAEPAGYGPAPLGADAMALSSGERQVVHLMRAMTEAQRGRFLDLAKRVLLDLDQAATGGTVEAKGNVSASGTASRAAGRDLKG